MRARGKLTPVRSGWTERLAMALADVVRSYHLGAPESRDVAAVPTAVRCMALVQRALNGEDVRPGVEGPDLFTSSAVSVEERDVLNLAKGWARELDGALFTLGKTFDEGKEEGNVTPGEVRLYQAVERFRRSEGRRRAAWRRSASVVAGRRR